MGTGLGGSDSSQEPLFTMDRGNSWLLVRSRGVSGRGCGGDQWPLERNLAGVLRRGPWGSGDLSGPKPPHTPPPPPLESPSRASPLARPPKILLRNPSLGIAPHTLLAGRHTTPDTDRRPPPQGHTGPCPMFGASRQEGWMLGSGGCSFFGGTVGDTGRGARHIHVSSILTLVPPSEWRQFCG